MNSIFSRHPASQISPSPSSSSAYRPGHAAGGYLIHSFTQFPDGWRIAHTGYRRTFEITYNLADLPGTKINGPGEHTHV